MIETIAYTSIAVMAAGTIAFVYAVVRWAVRPIEAPTPWTPAELHQMPAARLRDPCVHCGGKHCAGCEAPARVTSLAATHVARHDFAEVPPSLLWLAEHVHVTFRGALISAELMGRHVTRPADGTAFRLWAAHKLGRPLQLGVTRKVVLP